MDDIAGFLKENHNLYGGLEVDPFMHFQDDTEL